MFIALCLALALVSSEAYAIVPDRGRGGPGHDGRHYYNREGRWYRHGWLWFDTAVAALFVGAIVDNLPPRCTTVVHQGTPYYYADGYYYRPYNRGGYVVVAPPVVAQPVIVQQQVQAVQVPVQTNIQTSDVVTINIPNSRGGYTAVTLKRAGSGYVGPQGEYYSDNPTVAQLRTLYGGR